MKTAEQWANHFGTTDDGDEVGHSCIVLKMEDISQIQLDAFKSGLESAALYLIDEKHHMDDIVAEEILQLAKKVTVEYLK